MPEALMESRQATRRWILGGRVQGVGFRPHVCRLALRLGLNGWVRNRSGTVEILAQGDEARLAAFERALLRDAPRPARPRVLAVQDSVRPAPHGFTIRASADDPRAAIAVAPDQTLCPDCRAEIEDIANRRHRHAFASCAACGPRYSGIAALPYDRAATTMAGFSMCPACRAEYRDPADRRFHAQTLACPACGPRLSYIDRSGAREVDAAALRAAVACLQGGGIVAVKGVGGYHLLCDAADAVAIARLRRDKPRPDKPLAVMFPYDDALSAVRAGVLLDATHEAALRDTAAPIVIARLRDSHELAADALAPGLTEIGVLLPYSPLHHLLLCDLGRPVVATSANPRGEPVLTDGAEAEARLAGVTDGILHHDRPILRPAEDPVRRVIAGKPRMLRIGRGDAPLELALPFTLAEPLLAVGGHMKNTVALAFDDRVLVSPHIGGPDTPRGRALFAQTVADLQALHGVRAARVACDAHPGYASRAWAVASGLPVIEVFHHRAHAATVAGEAAHAGPWLVFTWDGIGYGEDGTLWGGEALLGGPGRWRRVASLRPFRIPGGRDAGRAPWRSALALCLDEGIAWPACPVDDAMIAHAWRRDLNCATTSSVGRLFDAAAALTGIAIEASHEGQGPMRLEAIAADDFEPGAPIALPLADDAQGVLRSDWAPLVDMLFDAARPPARRAAMFHDALAGALRDQACALRARHGAFTIGLSGGVFQNRRLTETVMRLLGADGFCVHLPSTVPYNDAGLAYGQVIEGAIGAGLAHGAWPCAN
jgi:hydrogenase maturation protein HypF